MCRTLGAAFAAAMILASGVFAGGLLGGRAEAMTLATPSTLTAAKADAGLVHPATNVCGTNGCVRVQTSPPRKRQHFNHHP